MFRKRRKSPGRKRRSSNRICPFCEMEAEYDAVICPQCYYELDNKAMHQGRSAGPVEKDNLWSELLKEVVPGVEEEYRVNVITMDEMTIEIKEYETEGDDEFFMMSQGGPSFAEVSEIAGLDQSKDSETGEGALTPAPAPIITKVEQTEQADYIEDVVETTVPKPVATPALAPPPIPDIGGLTGSDDALDDDLDEIIAAASLEKPQELTSVSSSPAFAVSQKQERLVGSPEEEVSTHSTTVPVPLLSPPSQTPPAAIAASPVSTAPVNGATSQPQSHLPALPTISASATVVTTSPVTAPPLPALPAVTPPAPIQSSSAIQPSTVASAEINGVTGIWPWLQAEPWDARDLRREIISAMEAARRGDRQMANAALERFGPHLGSRFEALHHIGALLHSLGRGEQMRAMVLAAQQAHPNDPNVSTAVAALLQS